MDTSVLYCTGSDINLNILECKFTKANSNIK